MVLPYDFFKNFDMDFPCWLLYGYSGQNLSLVRKVSPVKSFLWLEITRFKILMVRDQSGQNPGSICEFSSTQKLTLVWDKFVENIGLAWELNASSYYFERRLTASIYYLEGRITASLRCSLFSWKLAWIFIFFLYRGV